MAYQSALEVCRKDLFLAEKELREKYSPLIADKVMRIRGMYMWMLANPDSRDHEFVKQCVDVYGVSRPAAYDDLGVVKKILPAVADASREFARWRYNEMILETYRKAKDKGNVAVMEKAATSYAKNNRLDIDEEQRLPYDRIVIQPFVATEDPRVLGIEPIPNVQQRIEEMLKKYRAESMDIMDVDFEEADIEEDNLFEEEEDDENQGIGQGDLL